METNDLKMNEKQARNENTSAIARLLYVEQTLTFFWPLLYIGYLVPRSCPCWYVGQTGRTLSCQLTEHKAAVQNRDVSSSVLAEHWLDTGHAVTRDDATVIEPCHDW